MSDAPQSNGNLHLPNLTIKGFRGIKDLSIPRLGRVTLVAGKNGAGKTTLLEAVQVYAARGQYAALEGLLRSREELSEEFNEDSSKRQALNWETLFHDRRMSPDDCIRMGPKSGERQLSIEAISLGQMPLSFSDLERSPNDHIQWLQLRFRGMEYKVPMVSREQYQQARMYRRHEIEIPLEAKCESLGPSLLSNTSMARLWDNVALTDDESRAVKALNIVFGGEVDRVAVVGEYEGTRLPGRRAIVKVAGEDRPIPLKSLGDGASRLFGVALALANSRNGFLVIDEAENGIHHSVQRDFWKMVLRTAEENDVQVFAATHSWDCMRGFAQAATELEDVEGALIRLERYKGQTRAVEYSEEELQVAAEQGIEVR
jgi:ABC-type branched-subunit amino acid transport system ATPase component